MLMVVPLFTASRGLLRARRRQWLGVEAGLAHCRQRQRVRFCSGINTQRARSKLKSQGAYPRNRLQRLPNFGLLDGAIHGRYAEKLPRTPCFRRRGGRRWCARASWSAAVVGLCGGGRFGHGSGNHLCRRAGLTCTAAGIGLGVWQVFWFHALIGNPVSALRSSTE